MAGETLPEDAYIKARQYAAQEKARLRRYVTDNKK